ncbi:MAG: PHP-associated domain-containing protein, partial [bacterium]
VVGHIDLPKKFGHRLKDKDLKEMAQPVLDRIAAAGMAVELNTGGLRKPVEEIYPSALLLSLIREREIPICFGSDAHEPGHVGMDFDKALRLAKDVGYTTFVKFRKRAMLLTPLP